MKELDELEAAIEQFRVDWIGVDSLMAQGLFADVIPKAEALVRALRAGDMGISRKFSCSCSHPTHFFAIDILEEESNEL